MDTDPDAHATADPADTHPAAGVALVHARNWLVAIALAVASTVVVGTGALAQQPASSVEVTGTQLSGDTITAAVAVLDAASNPVVGLTEGQFAVQVDGQAVDGVTVTSGVDAALPLGIVLAVDTSGSMAGESIASARQSIVPLVNALQPADQAALLTFANEVAEVVPLTADRAVLAGAVEAMTASGNTALFAGVVRASEVAAAAPQPRRAVVLLSDGEDFGAVSGGITGEAALAAARASGVPYFVVGLGQEVDQPFLTALASDTGGQYFAAADPAQLAQLYVRISDRLRQQYTLVAPLPAGLAGGEHRLTVSVGEATGFGSFETEAAPAQPTLTVTEVPEVVDVPLTVSVAGATGDGAVRFELNGEELEPAANGSVTIDPYTLPPGDYTLVTRSSDEAVPAVTQTFTVPALPPEIVAPSSIPTLRPGDLIRLTIKAQPTDLVVSASVDGVEIFSATEPPYEFVLPEDDYGTGTHQLSITVEGAGGTASRGFEFDGPPGESTNYAAYILVALASLAVLAGLVFGGRRALGWYRARPEPIDVSVVGDQLAAWSELRRGRGNLADVAIAPVAATTASVWGALLVISGPDAGKRFALRDEAELVGRGEFCSVRLTDPNVEPAHFVVTRAGELTASTPQARVTLDGERVRTAEVKSGSVLRIGNCELELTLGDPQEDGAAD